MNMSRFRFICCSRNDQYRGDSVGRLIAALDCMAAGLERVEREMPVTVHDCTVVCWNSAVPLIENPRIQEKFHQTPWKRWIRFLTVPPSAAHACSPHPMSEVHALNCVARRSDPNTFLLRIDQDTMVGPAFLRWLCRPEREQEANDGTFWWSNRRDTAADDVSDILRDPVGFTAEQDIRAPQERAPLWSKNRMAAEQLGIGWTAVGCMGMSARTWQMLCGYCEQLTGFGLMEVELWTRIRKDPRIPAAVDVGQLTGHPFYHIWHVEPEPPNPNAWRCWKDQLPNDPSQWGLGVLEFNVFPASTSEH